MDYAGWRRAGGGACGSRAGDDPPGGAGPARGDALGHADEPVDRRRALPHPGRGRGHLRRARSPSAARARREWLMTFAHLGFVKDGAADHGRAARRRPGQHADPGQRQPVDDRRAAGRHRGGRGRAERLPRRGADRLRRETFPGKPIRYVTGGHHHADHSGGMRPFVALGARPVVHADAVAFFERVFAVRGSRLLPDRLDAQRGAGRHPRRARAGTVTLADPLRPVTVLAEPTEHATTTVLVRTGRGRAVRQRRHLQAGLAARPGRAIARRDDPGQRAAGRVDRRRPRRRRSPTPTSSGRSPSPERMNAGTAGVSPRRPGGTRCASRPAPPELERVAGGLLPRGGGDLRARGVPRRPDAPTVIRGSRTYSRPWRSARGTTGRQSPAPRGRGARIRVHSRA